MRPIKMNNRITAIQKRTVRELLQRHSCWKILCHNRLYRRYAEKPLSFKNEHQNHAKHNSEADDEEEEEGDR
jgi:hypothetical protein